MIGKGWFRQGHLDENEKCLIVSEDAWNQYRSTMENIHRQQAEKEAAEERMRQEYDSLTPEIKKVIQTGDEFVKLFREKRFPQRSRGWKCWWIRFLTV